MATNSDSNRGGKYHPSLKILYIHQHFRPPGMAGGGRSFELARRLVARGHDVTILTGTPTGTVRNELPRSVEGIRVRWIHSRYHSSMGFYRRLIAFADFSVRSCAFVVRHKHHVVFATSTPLTVAIPASAAHFLRRTPVVFEVRDAWPSVPISLGLLRNPFLVWLSRRLERHAYSISDSIVALSPGMATSVTSAGTDDKSVHIIPNLALGPTSPENAGLVGPWVDIYPELGSKRVALYQGSIGFIHGVSYLNAVAEHLDPRRHAIVVIGGGNRLDSFLDDAEKRGVLDRTIFHLPEIPRSLSPVGLAACEVALSTVIEDPVLEDNSANKFFEALGSGCPIAINYGGWQADLLETFRAGIRLNRDPKIGARQLASLLEDDALLGQMRVNSKTLGASVADPEASATKVESLLVSAALRNSHRDLTPVARSS